MHKEIEQQKHEQHDAADEQRFLPQMFRRPEEIDASQKSDEQRRVTEWRQRAADIRDQKNKEHHHMRAVSAIVIGADQRPDLNHRRARCADDACHQASDAKQHRIGQHAVVKVAFEIDTTGNRKQCEQQKDERHVFE